MEDFYLSQALFRTQEIVDDFTNERSMQIKLKALTENGRIEKIKNGLYATVNSLTDDIFAVKEFANKNYRPELLFEEKDIVERISAHPMALWRVREN